MTSHHIMPSDTHQHPTMYFDELGAYEITLIATNVIGSDTVIKQQYIQVVQEQIMCVDNQSNMVSGYLYDDGGKDGTYSNPIVGDERTCTFLIEPKCASSISLAFLDFDVVEVGNSACPTLPGDAVRIYDGTDNTGTPLHLQFVNPFSGQPDYPLGFDNRHGVIPPGVTANSGSMFVEFYVNCGSVGQGFEARWNTVSYTPVTPVASISAPTQAYIGTPLALNSTSTGEYLDYGWDLDADGSNDYMSENIIHTFTSPGTYTVRLIIYSCHDMTDTAYHTITVVNPPNPPNVDFTVDYTKLTPQDIATFTDLSHESVTSWNWEITPNTCSFVNGTSNSSQHPQVQFHNTGFYTVKLTVDNYLGSNSVTKSNYIEVYVYCNPAVAVLNSDVGISVMTLQNIFGDTLIHQMSDIGVQGYTDYSLTQQAALTKGGSYTITLKRNSVFNDISRSLWIDLNKDGAFDDNEELASDINKGTLQWTSNFTVPLTAQEGLSRLRVGVNLGNQKNKGCGPNYSGEFEDYGITINTDETSPVITLQGSDTQIVNSCANWTDPGYTAIDDVNGDLTSGVTVTGGPVTTTVADTFYLKYNVSDVAGNPADEVTRVVVVLSDIIPPVITLNGQNPDSIRVKTAYVDPRATATDDCSGLATPANFAAINTLNTNYLGTYELHYVAEDNAGNADTTSRTVVIYDDIDPVISLNGNNVMSMEVNTSFNDPGVTFSDNYDNNMQVKIIGSVDTSRIGTYFLNYCVSDSSGNGPVCVDRTIEVYDNTGPALTLKGLDTVIVEVFGVYNEPGYLYSDNYYSQNDIIVKVSGSVNTYVLGDYLLNYTATDGSGNVSTTLQRLVRVVDLVKPTIRLNGANMVTVKRWNDFVDPGVTVMDNYDKASDITVFYNENGSWDNDSKLQIGLFTYTYRAEDKSGNSSEEITRLIYVEQNTSIEDQILTMNNISFYPNPAEDHLNINIDFPEFNELSINIYNALGEKVLEVFDGLFKDGSMPVDISSLKSGIYFIRFQVAEDQQMNSKLIVR
jgi:PKD repeat protein